MYFAFCRPRIIDLLVHGEIHLCTTYCTCGFNAYSRYIYSVHLYGIYTALLPSAQEGRKHALLLLHLLNMLRHLSMYMYLTVSNFSGFVGIPL